MKRIKILSAISALVLLTACSDSTEESQLPREQVITSTVSEETGKTDFDLSLIAQASRTSALLEKYPNIKLTYTMDYGEIYNEVMTISRNSKGQPYFVSISDGDSEYYDGANNYWQETHEGETLCYAQLSLRDAPPMDMENYIFTYSTEDGLTVTDYTQTDDGSYIITAEEIYTERYELDNNDTAAIELKYEYVISTTPDHELTGMKCTCTDSETGEVDSTLDLTVEYEAVTPVLPDFMNDTYVITAAVTRHDGTELTEEFEVPEGFMPYFSTPDDGDYKFSLDPDGLEIIDTMDITGPCTVYVLPLTDTAAD